jgi:hypothetical protein
MLSTSFMSRLFFTDSRNLIFVFFADKGRRPYKPFPQPQSYSIPSPAISGRHSGVRTTFTFSSLPWYCSKVSSSMKSVRRLIRCFRLKSLLNCSRHSADSIFDFRFSHDRLLPSKSLPHDIDTEAISSFLSRPQL